MMVDTLPIELLAEPHAMRLDLHFVKESRYGQTLTIGSRHEADCWLFEIKDNPNISIDLSEVCPYIEMGYYELIYDSTQNIRGCDALNLD